MPYVLIKHKVRDYRTLEAVFMEDEERRRMAGSRSARMFKIDEEPGEYVALIEWDDVEAARKFAASYELREAVEWAGDLHPLEAVVIEEVLATDA
ncbi:MAG TPA: antibiotic biosynthesis monooxygenase [Thermoleophilia bacterium]|nr:antibiotic biosynthesis monooxygenase [Thermoleophilia bacterium]